MLKNWLSKVAEYKMTGIMWHNHWKNVMDYMGLTGYRHWQEFRVFNEMMEYEKFSHKAIQHFNVIPETPTIDMIAIHGATPDADRFTMIGAEKKEHLHSFLMNWLAHECSGKDMYAEGLAWANKNNHCSAAAMFGKMLEDSMDEIEMINNEILFCESVEWDMPTLVVRQEQMYLYYKEKCKDICKCLK